MNVFAKLLRVLARVHFRLRGLATIPEIPTAEFNRLVAELQAMGWLKAYEYIGPDAWIDYGCVHLSRDGMSLTCEWDNFHEGSFSGRSPALAVVAKLSGREPAPEWRWSLWG
ncbi:hypothetical protein QUB67_34950 [Microcoleus sp. ARI1-A1]